MPSRESRFAGSLIGQCLGDALGFPVEGYVADVCRQYVAGILRSGRAGEVNRPPYPFGQYTDDSQLARELLISYRETGRLDPADYARRIAALFAERMVVGEYELTVERVYEQPVLRVRNTRTGRRHILFLWRDMDKRDGVGFAWRALATVVTVPIDVATSPVQVPWWLYKRESLFEGIRLIP